MNVKTVKKPESRVDTSYISTLNIQGYGLDNLYPQNLQRILGASGTASLCVERYAEFIEGNGFDDVALAELVLGRNGETADELLSLIAADVANFGGFALHVNYDVFCKIVEVQYVPFEACRLEEEDVAGYVGHVMVHPDWRGEKTRAGRALKIDRSMVKSFPVFNTQYEVVRAQIEAVGGVENYQGQILWCSMDGKNVYPTPRYDAIITEMSTDEGLSNIKNRNVRNNFLVSCMLVTKKGVPRFDEDGNEVERSMIQGEDLKKFQGDTNGNKILLVEIENDEDKPEVVDFPAKNYDKDFTVTEESTVERIYAQFGQELFYAIRMGKLGFSGQVMADAYSDYAGKVGKEQRFIMRGFKAVLDNWHEPLNVRYDIEERRYIVNNGTGASVNG